jgi:hypothetical protein
VKCANGSLGKVIHLIGYILVIHDRMAVKRGSSLPPLPTAAEIFHRRYPLPAVGSLRGLDGLNRLVGGDATHALNYSRGPVNLN